MTSNKKYLLETSDPTQEVNFASRSDLPPFVVPLVTRVLEPWTTGEAERSPEAMVLSFQVLGAGSPVNRAA